MKSNCDFVLVFATLRFYPSFSERKAPFAPALDSVSWTSVKKNENKLRAAVLHVPRTDQRAATATLDTDLGHPALDRAVSSPHPADTSWRTLPAASAAARKEPPVAAA